MIISTAVRCARFFLHGIDRMCAYSLIMLIYLLRPMLGPMNMCPMVKSGVEKLGCTQYAVLELEKQPVIWACSNIIRRLVKCHPYTCPPELVSPP